MYLIVQTGKEEKKEERIIRANASFALPYAIYFSLASIYRDASVTLQPKSIVFCKDANINKTCNQVSLLVYLNDGNYLHRTFYLIIRDIIIIKKKILQVRNKFIPSKNLETEVYYIY